MGWFVGDAAHAAGVDWYEDGFADLDSIVWPEAVGLAEECGLAVVLQNYAREGVGGFDVVYVDKGVGVFVGCHAGEIVGSAALV